MNFIPLQPLWPFASRIKNFPQYVKILLIIKKMTDVTDIQSLDEQIRPLLSSEDLSKYVELTKDLLQNYAKYPRKINFMAKKKDPIKDKIVNDFIIRTLMIFRGNSQNRSSQIINNNMLEYITQIRRQESVISENKCQECSSDNLSIDSDTGNLVCMNCGFEMLDLSDRNIAYRDAETMTVIRKPIYERTKHFRDLVNQYQGKLTRSIDPEIIERLRICFKTNGIDPRTVSRRNICTFLLELGHSELYDSVNYLL